MAVFLVNYGGFSSSNSNLSRFFLFQPFLFPREGGKGCILL